VISQRQMVRTSTSAVDVDVDVDVHVHVHVHVHGMRRAPTGAQIVQVILARAL